MATSINFLPPWLLWAAGIIILLLFAAWAWGEWGNAVASLWYRRRKLNPNVWMVRQRNAFDNLWLRFYRMPRTEKTLQWAERNHARIINTKPPWIARGAWRERWKRRKP